MKKIEFAIQEAFNGVTTVYKSSDSDWINNIIDLRSGIKGAKLREGAEFYELRFREDGLLVVAGRFVPSNRGDEYYAAWIYFPSSIVIGLGENEIQDKVARLLQMLDNTSLMTDVEKKNSVYDKIKQDIFDKSYLKYTPIEFQPSRQSGTDNTYAIRYYKDSNDLKRLLNPVHLLQNEYANHIGILIVNQEDTVGETKYKNITNDKLEKVTCVKFKDFPSDVTVTYKDIDQDKDLKDSGFIGRINDLVTLSYRKSGRANRVETVRIVPNMEIEYSKKTIWHVKVDDERFIVTDETGEQINDFTKELKGAKNGNLVPEDKADKLVVRFKADGYENKSVVVNLLTQPKVHVVMQGRKIDRTYSLRLKNGTRHNIIVNELVKDEKESPVNGYRISGENKDKTINLKISKRPFYVGLLIGLLLGAIVVVVSLVFSRKTTLVESGEKITQVVSGHDSTIVSKDTTTNVPASK